MPHLRTTVAGILLNNGINHHHTTPLSIQTSHLNGVLHPSQTHKLVWDANYVTDLAILPVFVVLNLTIIWKPRQTLLQVPIIPLALLRLLTLEHLITLLLILKPLPTYKTTKVQKKSQWAMVTKSRSFTLVALNCLHQILDFNSLILYVLLILNKLDICFPNLQR